MLQMMKERIQQPEERNKLEEQQIIAEDKARRDMHRILPLLNEWVKAPWINRGRAVDMSGHDSSNNNRPFNFFNTTALFVI